MKETNSSASRPVRRNLAGAFLIATVALIANGVVFAGSSPTPDLPARIEAIVAKSLVEGRYPGLAVAVEHHDTVIYEGGAGFADLEHKAPMTAHTVMPVGSVTKSFTALSVMQLVHANKLSLEAALRTYLPAYDGPARDIQIRNLLNHTSGIANYTNEPGYPDPQTSLTNEQVIGFIKDKPLEFTPGTRFKYTNSDTYLLGMMIEKVSGQSYAEYLREHVFEPFGMSESYAAGYRDVIPNRGRGYEIDGASVRNARQYDFNYPFSAGVVLSSVSDLLKYAHHVFEGEATPVEVRQHVLQREALRDGTPLSYALGCLLIGELAGHRKIHHGGRIEGFAAQYAYYPDDDLTIAVIGNLGAPAISPSSIEVKIAREVLGLPAPKIVDNPLTAAELKAFSGNYETTPISFGAGRMSFRAHDGRLHIQRGSTDSSGIPLRYQGAGLFVSTRDDETTYQFEVGEQASSAVLLVLQGTAVRAGRMP